MFTRAFRTSAIGTALVILPVFPVQAADPPAHERQVVANQTPQPGAHCSVRRSVSTPAPMRVQTVPGASESDVGVERARSQRVGRGRLHARSRGFRRRFRGYMSYPYGYPPPAYWDYGYGGYGQGYSPDQWRRYWDNRYEAWRHYDRLERQHRFNVRDMRRRRRKLISQHAEALTAGLERLRAGDTARAIATLRLAADLNQGDPACRIHLAQARLERGQYAQAAQALRAALRLQPRLAYADLHLDTYYAVPGTLAASTGRLRTYLASRPAPPDLYFLLGFLEFQQGKLVAAHTAFGHVAAAWPHDDLTRTFLDLTAPAEP